MSSRSHSRRRAHSRPLVALIHPLRVLLNAKIHNIPLFYLFWSFFLCQFGVFLAHFFSAKILDRIISCAKKWIFRKSDVYIRSVFYYTLYIVLCDRSVMHYHSLSSLCHQQGDQKMLDQQSPQLPDNYNEVWIATKLV